MPTLNWMGKEAVRNHHHTVPFHLLRDVPELSLGDSGSGNLIVEGDNLVALKALLPYYAGQVKCIYIDPPYNTGNENWVYNDNVNSPIINEWLGNVVGREAEDLSRHDKWLCMMYPRLALLKEFLNQEGVIIVSIDDFEAYRMRFLLDEIFQPQNFIAQLVWDKTRKNDAKLFSVGHEYLIVYAASLATLRAKRTVWREAKPGADAVIAHVNDLRAKHGSDFKVIERELRSWYSNLPKSDPAKALSRHKHVDESGVWRDRDISWPGGGGPRYDVPHPVTTFPCKVPEAGWRFATIESMNQQIAAGLVVFREDHTQPPFRKSYLNSPDYSGDDSELSEDSDEEILGFRTTEYAPSSLYEGAFQFQKHFYGPKPGELRDGEEGDCAKFIDGLREVKFWVRNLSRKPGSFRFQTSTDSFYPDFVCQLIDGRLLVVEYKGQHLFDTPDAEEKRLVGQAWESLSAGKCLFLMLTKKNFAAISAKIGDLAHADDFRLS